MILWNRLCVLKHSRTVFTHRLADTARTDGWLIPALPDDRFLTAETTVSTPDLVKTLLALGVGGERWGTISSALFFYF